MTRNSNSRPSRKEHAFTRPTATVSHRQHIATSTSGNNAGRRPTLASLSHPAKTERSFLPIARLQIHSHIAHDIARRHMTLKLAVVPAVEDAAEGAGAQETGGCPALQIDADSVLSMDELREEIRGL